MSHAWIRLDTNLPTHDKVLRLTSTGNHRAAFVYVCALAWSGGNGTEGHIPDYVIGMIHARKSDIDALVSVGLLETDDGGWVIRNWEQRQKPHSGAKAACIRWHGKECGCWKD